MTNVIVALIVLGILAAAGYYVYRARKRGDKCVGCPYAKQCGAAGGCHCGGK